MAYVNDPSELALLPLPESQIYEDEEPRDYHEFFYDDQPPSNFRQVGYPEYLHTEVTCHFNGQGEHTYMSPNCPHFDEYDQEGRRIRENWTVQIGAY